MSSRTPKTPKTPTQHSSTSVTPSHTPHNDVPQGNEELAAFLMSPKGIIIVVIIFFVIFVSTILIFNILGQRATTIWAVVVVCFLFLIRHLIGNAETKISHTQ